MATQAVAPQTTAVLVLISKEPCPSHQVRLCLSLLEKVVWRLQLAAQALRRPTVVVAVFHQVVTPHRIPQVAVVRRFRDQAPILSQQVLEEVQE